MIERYQPDKHPLHTQPTLTLEQLNEIIKDSRIKDIPLKAQPIHATKQCSHCNSPNTQPTFLFAVDNDSSDPIADWEIICETCGQKTTYYRTKYSETAMWYNLMPINPDFEEET